MTDYTDRLGEALRRHEKMTAKWLAKEIRNLMSKGE